MKAFLRTTTAAVALVLSIASAQAQYQGSDEARGYAQGWAAARGYYGSGYNGAYARYYGRSYRNWR
jgi:hypothetical protein